MKVIVDKIPLDASRCKFAEISPISPMHVCWLKGNGVICDKQRSRPCEELITFKEMLDLYKKSNESADEMVVENIAKHFFNKCLSCSNLTTPISEEPCKSCKLNQRSIDIYGD